MTGTLVLMLVFVCPELDKMHIHIMWQFSFGVLKERCLYASDPIVIPIFP